MKDQAVTMETKSAIKKQDVHEHVHLQLLFQSLGTVGMKNGELQTLIMSFVTITLSLIMSAGGVYVLIILMTLII